MSQTPWEVKYAADLALRRCNRHLGVPSVSYDERSSESEDDSPVAAAAPADVPVAAAAPADVPVAAAAPADVPVAAAAPADDMVIAARLIDAGIPYDAIMVPVVIEVAGGSALPATKTA